MRGGFGKGGGDRGRGDRGGYGDRGGGKGKGGGKGGPRGPRFQESNYQSRPLPTFDAKYLPTSFVGPFSWTGRPAAKEGLTLEQTKKLGSSGLGAPVKTVANMIAIDLNVGADQHQYRVDITPAIELRNRKAFAVHLALEDPAEKGLTHWFDGDAIVYTSAQIPADFLEKQVPISVGGGETVTHKVEFRHAGHSTAKVNVDSVRIFCTAFKAALGTLPGRKLVGRDYFDFSEHARTNIPNQTCFLVPGLNATIYVAEKGPLLNVDMMFKQIRTDTVYDMMGPYWNNPQRESLIKSNFEHTVVMANYGKQTSFIVDEVRFDLTPKSKFYNKKQGKEMTYAEYFKLHYNVGDGDLDMTQPLLENRSRREVDENGNPKVTHYIPQLCALTGLTDDMKRDVRRGREVIRHTALKPHERLEKVHQYLIQCTQHEEFNTQLKKAGMGIRPGFAEMDARRLPSPEMKNGAGPIQIRSDTESWDVKFQWPMYRPANFTKWCVVCHQQNQSVKRFIETLQQPLAGQLKVQVANPKVYDTQGNTTPQGYLNVLKQQVLPLKPDFIMVVLPREMEKPYRAVKELLCVEAGIPSQFVTEKNISQDPLLKGTKVLVQMVCKAQGAPWTVNCKLDVPTMFVGLDRHHGGDLEHKGGSVASLVASVDREVTKYYSRTFVTKARQQILEPAEGQPGLKKLFQDTLEAFKGANGGRIPQLIVVYRDGGSEGELNDIAEYEIGEIKKAFAGLPQAPKLIFQVVLKTIRTRFFQKDPSGTGVANPPPGTCIDSEIVSSTLPEYLICCQSVNQGSATPTKYQIIYNDSPVAAAALQMYTYCLSHMYYNWFGTIRTPCVLKYASTYAKFSGQNLRGKEHPQQALAKSLFYL